MQHLMPLAVGIELLPEIAKARCQIALFEGGAREGFETV